MCIDLRGLRERMDIRTDRVESKLDSFATKADLDSFAKKVDDRFVSLEGKLDKDFFWLLSLQLGFAAGMLGVMARVFGWI